MKVTMIGVKKTETSKNGQTRTNFYYSGLKDYTPYEQENALCEGQDVVREWSITDFNIHPGDVVEFIYEPGFQDKATLVDIRVLKIADNPFPDKEKALDKPAADPKTKVGA